jgi:hypothetical protein
MEMDICTRPVRDRHRNYSKYIPSDGNNKYLHNHIVYGRTIMLNSYNNRNEQPPAKSNDESSKYSRNEIFFLQY